MLYRVHNKELLLGLHCHGIMLNRVVTNAKRFCSCYNSCKNPRESVDVITRKHERKRCSKKIEKTIFKNNNNSSEKNPNWYSFLPSSGCGYAFDFSVGAKCQLVD